jgi:hypothetical protein
MPRPAMTKMNLLMIRRLIEVECPITPVSAARTNPANALCCGHQGKTLLFLRSPFRLLRTFESRPMGISGQSSRDAPYDDALADIETAHNDCLVIMRQTGPDRAGFEGPLLDLNEHPIPLISLDQGCCRSWAFIHAPPPFA